MIPQPKRRANASSRALARIVSAVALAIAVTLAAALPAMHYWLASDHALAEMRSAARLSASSTATMTTTGV